MTEQLRKDRAAAGRIGGLRRAARDLDPTATARSGQRGLTARFDAQVPAEITDPAERARRIGLLRRAHMADLAHKSAKARARRAA
ncbi:hypothetical protein QTQ03_16500 [Micromonospora sp. WMMA1363]|uniref:hypothetical protein n=1 Tax=Micromonospora sp. WMMA1363 TaxID=3053985 RepID=UPI00259C89C5|nr:hypothetical protein [Micromonospora sp. WMMA1363]MDM4721119.1 hypothetical protein [Micromonospora sp. WMMA1363]